MTREAFKTWWYNEGSQAPYTHHDCEEHTMRMCEIAWNKAQFLAQPEDPCKGANYLQASEQELVAWLLTDKNINSLQVDSIQRLIDRLKHSHHTDLCVRINGQDEWFEADWLKHMTRTSPPQRQPLTVDEIQDIGRFAYCRGSTTEKLYQIMWNAQPSASIGWDRQELIAFARAIEQAHGIKENT